MSKISVVLLKKNLINIDSYSDSWINYPYSHWITLGHFDDMYIYSLENEKTFFEAIQEDKNRILSHNDDEEYYHPLYIVPSGIGTVGASAPKIFIAIVRIHFLNSIHLTRQFNGVCECIKKELDSEKFFYQIYYGTEFSDIVLDVRSDSMKKLVDTVLNLRKINTCDIGKMYTYFGISSDFLKQKKELPYANETLQMFSMRFSGYDMEVAKKQIELVKNELKGEDEAETTEYFINGIDDIMLFFEDRNTSSIIELYRKWLYDDEYLNVRKSESSSKVGIRIDTNSDDETQYYRSSSSITPRVCDNLMNDCKEIHNLISLRSDKENFGWFHAISEIANSLIRMSKTPVMDEVVYLVAPGVNAFLKNVLLLLKQDMIDRNFNYLYDFVESCSYYIEQLMRIEGQLSHNPETRPVIYDIPVFMLEYTIAFLQKVSKLLKNRDENPDRINTVFLLVPHPCELVSALEIFRANSIVPGLVHIQIPENILYTPTELFGYLCHEISHYVGESYRNRKIRKDLYSHAVASVLIQYVFQSNDENLLGMFKEMFIELLEDCESLTIKEMHIKLYRFVYTMVSQEECTDRITKLYFDYCSRNNVYPENFGYIEDEIVSLLVANCFEEIVEDFNVLFREVFADICMIYLLNISSSDYVESLLKELERHPNKSRVCKEFFSIRIYVTLTAMNMERQCHGNRYWNLWEEINEIINMINEEILEGVDGKYRLPFSMDAVYQLLVYAKECYKSISNSLSQQDTYEVREMYKALEVEPFDYHYVLEKIEECRKGMSAESNE